MHECEICGNTFEIDWIKEGQEYNDFGYRYCPFCGTMFDTIIIEKFERSEKGRRRQQT